MVESLSDFGTDDDLVEHEDAQVFLRPGLPRGVLRKLRGGHWVVQSELDLHGLRVDEAREALARFLAEVRRRGDRCVRIIHGKGLRSRNREPVLKSKVRGWLRQRDEVLAFVEARPIAGGSGAVVVLLKAATVR
jgi:DNA-nicking Smr family endonuclease